jgi:hypothetical protein
MNTFTEAATCVCVGYPQEGPKNYWVRLYLNEAEFERFKRFAEETEKEGTFRQVREG